MKESKILEEIEWKLKNIWSEYHSNMKDKEKAKKLLEEYQKLQTVYKRQKMIISEL